MKTTKALYAGRMALAASLLFAAACGGSDETREAADAPPPSDEAAQSTPPADAAADAPAQSRAPSDAGDELVEVMLCDGETSVTASADGNSQDEGQRIADELMAQWKRKNPDAGWIEAETEKHQVKRPVDNMELVGKGQGATYGRITEADVKLWEHETYKMAVEGSTIFHSADLLGSTIAVSCDMCHPDSANTHPETYPKFQEQLGRVALLRDMINWCIEHPVRGEKLEPDSAEMRALEAYIIAQRQGEAIQYGRR